MEHPFVAVVCRDCLSVGINMRRVGESKAPLNRCQSCGSESVIPLESDGARQLLGDKYEERVMSAEEEMSGTVEQWSVSKQKLSRKSKKTIRLVLLAIGGLLVVIFAIIGSMLVVTGKAASDRLGEAKADATVLQISNLEGALVQYRVNYGAYPTTEQGLQVLIEPPPDRRGVSRPSYLDSDHVPTDAWGFSFEYRSPGASGRDYDIVSLGADGESGGTGLMADINSWEI